MSTTLKKRMKISWTIGYLSRIGSTFPLLYFKTWNNYTIIFFISVLFKPERGLFFITYKSNSGEYNVHFRCSNKSGLPLPPSSDISSWIELLLVKNSLMKTTVKTLNMLLQVSPHHFTSSIPNYFLRIGLMILLVL